MMTRIVICVVAILLVATYVAVSFVDRSANMNVLANEAQAKDVAKITAKAKGKSENKVKPRSKKKKGHTHYAMCKNPLYKTDPVLYDSGEEEDNSSCMICHADFAEEKISTIHLEAGMTCMACHGDSETHRADEYNIIRPDVLWGRGEMAAFCSQCHLKHKYPEKVDEFRKENFSKRMPNGRWIDETSACLDCHGNHAISTGEEGSFK